MSSEEHPVQGHRSAFDKWFWRFINSISAGVGLLVVYLMISHFLEVVL